MSKSSDFWEFASLDKLLAMAGSMESQAIRAYEALAARMRVQGRPDLAEVFDSLVSEEKEHLAKVDEWAHASARGDVPYDEDMPDDLFQDEGAATVAPELLSAYRAFSTAVRNEERAFAFWTYVSAHAKSAEIKDAAERMAREELGHVSTLRRERRKAFHAERAAGPGDQPSLLSLEQSLGGKLEAMSAVEGGDHAVGECLEQSRERMRRAAMKEPKVAPPYRIGAVEAIEPLALAEYLLDWYIEIGDKTGSEQEAEQARAHAAQMIACLRAIRASRASSPI
jgi:rubrerythrin